MAQAKRIKVIQSWQASMVNSMAIKHGINQTMKGVRDDIALTSICRDIDLTIECHISDRTIAYGISDLTIA
jgi:ribosomal protein L7Ae-like RNA K-turn-binding protein